MIALCFDPGESIGIAQVKGEGSRHEPLLVQNINYSDLAEWIKLNQELFAQSDIIVIEDYRVLAKKAMAHAGSKLETTRAIGRIQMIADLHDKKVVFSSAANNKVNLSAAGLAHILKESHKSTHCWYAYAHGVAIMRRLKAIR